VLTLLELLPNSCKVNKKIRFIVFVKKTTWVLSAYVLLMLKIYITGIFSWLSFCQNLYFAKFYNTFFQVHNEANKLDLKCAIYLHLTVALRIYSIY